MACSEELEPESIVALRSGASTAVQSTYLKSLDDWKPESPEALKLCWSVYLPQKLFPPHCSETPLTSAKVFDCVNTAARSFTPP